jgi:hypothetical protein
VTPLPAEAANISRPGDIPRRYYNGKPAGPLLIPLGEKHIDGDFECEMCHRHVAPQRGKPRKGSCKCQYFKRCTTWIDVLQDEFALKKWDRRMVAYGMSQRPDLCLLASASDPNDYRENSVLQSIAGKAIDAAQGDAAANIGTGLHRLTERMDRGETLGIVPDPYPADLAAYEQCTKDIEWVGIESFRVHDEYKVAGTTDRIGWYNGRLAIFDLKSSAKQNPISYPHGPAMQLAMYSKSVPYIYPGDYRTTDVAEIDPDVAYIINMPAGSGHCELRPIDIAKGWRACQLAVQVWTWRDEKNLILNPDEVRTETDSRTETFIEMAARATNRKECTMLAQNAKDQGCLTPQLRAALNKRWTELKNA